MSFHTFCRAEPTFRESQTNWKNEGDLNEDGLKNLKDLKLTTKEIELYFEEDPSRPDGNCFYHSMVDYIEGNDTEIYNTIFETPAYLEEWIKEHALYEANSKVGFKEEEMFMMHWLRKLVYEESLKTTKNEKNGDATSPSTIEFRERLLKGVEQTKSDQNVYYGDEGEVVGSKSHGHVGTDLWTMDREIDLTARFLKIDICTFQRIGGKDEWIMSLYDTAKDVLDGPICFLKNNNGVHFTNLKFEGKAKKNAKDAEVAKLKMAKLLQEARDRKKARKAEKAREEAEPNSQKDDSAVEEDNSPLYTACQYGRVDDVRLLLAQPGININQARDDGVTPLIIACYNGHADVVKLLLVKEDLDVNLDTNKGATPLSTACIRGHANVVKLLLARKEIKINQGEKSGATPLYIACAKGHVDVVKLLLYNKYIDVNLAQKDGQTPLYMACIQGHVDVVKLLLDREEILINTQNFRKYTPLHAACMYCREDVVRLLLAEKNIQVNKTSEDGLAALDIVIANGCFGIIKDLIRKGAKEQGPYPKYH